MSKTEILKAVMYSAIISVLFVSAVFLADIISYGSTVLSIAYIILTAAMYGFCLISRNRIIWLIKWGASLPLSYIVFKYFQTYHYSIRALNRAFPGYGRQTAGGAFAKVGRFYILAFFCAVTGIAAMFIKPKSFDKFGKVQLIIALAAAGATIAAVLMLERQFPPYEYIEAYINS
jgi:hypothetical protein